MDLDPETLAALVAEGEGPRLEFKRGLPRAERIARTLCAFANTKGGLLVVGIDDDGRPYGVPDPADVAARLRAVARDILEPPVVLQTRALRLAGRRVLACAVPASRSRPHAVRRPGGNSEVVVRVGASNRIARGATLAALARGSAARSSLDALEKSVLAWVERHARASHGGARPTVRAFAGAHNVGVQRARRAFLRLEREGFLVGTGPGSQRTYAVP